MLHAWADALIECQRNEDVRAVVLTGTGRAFCAGGDVNGMNERKQAESPIERKASLTNRVYRIPLIMDSMDKRSEEHTSELQSLMRISYAVFCLKKKNTSKQRKNDKTSEP